MFTEQAFALIVFLLPGFISMTVLDMLAPAKKKDSLQKLINALIFSLIIYLLYSLVFEEYPTLITQKTDSAFPGYLITLTFKESSLLLIISLLIPILISASIKYDFHMKLLRRLKITDETSRENSWYDIFTDIKTFVIINFDDDRRLYGWPEYFSESAVNRILFLTHAAWIDNENNLIRLDNRGVLIPPDAHIQTIEFLHQGEKNEKFILDREEKPEV